PRRPADPKRGRRLGAVQAGGGVDHVLIDEAQDTAPEQWAIVRALTGEFYSGEKSGRTVFAVGDEKQSIYSFQGARPERLRQERRAFLALA
ncbi:UvrD-helicase domain-containing protein, partial [Mycobacterium ostraviense]|uniref:UvrD-helicase domain-containing protein n=1 Tax=Mycobacterium ostraviense TaxID=2738409 RepID=UPI00195744EC